MQVMTTWINLMIRYRYWVIGAVLAVTVGLMSQIGHLQIIVSSDNMLPQSNHYIKTGNEIEAIFGHKFTIAIAVTATQGTIFQTAILEKVKRITTRIANDPMVIKSSVTGLAARKVKGIEGNQEGMMVNALMDKVPQDQAGIDALKKAVASNPVYDDLLVSKDQKTTLIVADVKDTGKGMSVIDEAIRAAVDPERDATVDISLGGQSIPLAQLERFSARMAFFLPLALLIIGLIHYEAFRTFQALLLPLVTAVIAVIWSLSSLAALRQPMDVFNAATPILILAIAAGHAVQVLKRYYEEYGKLKEASPHKDLKELSRLAIVTAMTRIGPVMVVACIVAALGFFSLYIFEIKSVQTFGILTGLGVLSALILELTLIPALRSALKPPGDKERRREQERTLWDRLLERLLYLVMERRRAVTVITLAFLACVSLGGYLLKSESSTKQLFFGSQPIIADDNKINSRMAGSNTIYLLVDTGVDDGIKNPAVLQAMEKVQDHLAQDPLVGKTVSLADFLKRMNQAMNADSPSSYRIPTSSDLAAQYLLLYANSGDPGDFDSYVDYGYRKAVIQIFYKSDLTTDLVAIAKQTQEYAASVFPHDVKVTVGGGVIPTVALHEEMVRTKVLNILQILGCVFLLTSLVFRSPLAGLLILTPLVATVFANFGFMGLAGIPLNIPTALVSAMAVGIAADYAIYLAYRLREELRSDLPEAEAIRRAFMSAGKATIFVSTAVAGGFGLLVTSWGFNVHVWMGLLIALAMVVSAFSTLTVFASLILTLRPKFIFNGKARDLSWNPDLSKA
jgi:predicted RND superfamily exporter protein